MLGSAHLFSVSKFFFDEYGKYKILKAQKLKAYSIITYCSVDENKNPKSQSWLDVFIQTLSIEQFYQLRKKNPCYYNCLWTV